MLEHLIDRVQRVSVVAASDGRQVERQLDLPVLSGKADAVVRDADIARPPAADLDGYILRPSVERVLDQLLDDGSRTLDHLAGGDHISHMGLKYVYDRHMVSP